jgi:heat shock protein HslJ
VVAFKDIKRSHSWQWVSFTSPVEQFDVEAPAYYVLAFNDNGTVEITANCNNAGGSYTTEGGSLTIEIGPMTPAACRPGSRGIDFVKYLGSAAKYFFKDGNLFIDLLTDVGTVYVQMFDVTLANRVGAPPGLCFHSPTCGVALAMEHNGDLYSCDHFVEPEYLLGNIREKRMVEMIALGKQQKFGSDKLDKLP